MELLSESCAPYSDLETPECTLRVFVEDVEEKKLVWHRDRKDITFKVIGGKDWKLQFDRQPTIDLELNQTYFIPREMMHRMIKGKNNLILEVHED